jgi:hypothetical protein
VAENLRLSWLLLCRSILAGMLHIWRRRSGAAAAYTGTEHRPEGEGGTRLGRRNGVMGGHERGGAREVGGSLGGGSSLYAWVALSSPGAKRDKDTAGCSHTRRHSSSSFVRAGSAYDSTSFGSASQACRPHGAPAARLRRRWTTSFCIVACWRATGRISVGRSNLPTVYA